MNIFEILFGQQLFSNKKSIKDQLKDLEEFGIFMNKDFDLYGEVNEREGVEYFEENYYTPLYRVLGLQDSNGVFGCDLIHSFDQERIEDSGDYSGLLEDMMRITGGELDLKVTTDLYEYDDHWAQIIGTLNDTDFKIELNQFNDWVDTTFYIQLSEVVQNLPNINKNFVFYTEGGNEMTIGWMSEDEAHEFNRKLRLNVSYKY